MKWRVVLPSWSLLEPGLQVETGSRFAAFIPLGGKPMYRHIADSPVYAGADADVVVVLSPQAGALEPEDGAPDRARAVRLSHSRSIGETVLAALDDLQAGQPVVVNMADTLVRLDGALEFDAVYTQPRSDLYRWTTVEAGPQGSVRVTHDRDTVDPQLAEQEVCVGIFTFADGPRWRRLLADAVAHDRPGAPTRVEPLFLALERYSAERPMTLRRAAQWFDCGHVDTYYESRLGYQNLRRFNSLAYDPLQGIVTKTSSRTEQFRHQVRWFKQVPDSLAAFLPRIYASSDSDRPFITMELLSIPTLAELFVSARLSPGAWNGVVRTLSHIQRLMRGFAFESRLSHELSRSMYLDKTRQRLEQFLHADPAATGYHIVQDGRATSLAEAIDGLERFVVGAGLLQPSSLAPIHGDFCFSNLLFDPKSRVVKMIDPRGEFGVPGIYGDPRYDLAKLAHSFAGGYDFIVSDRFRLDLAGSREIRLTTPMAAYHRQVRAIFDLVLLGDRRLAHEVLAIQALLFLSMLPLHSDTPRCQLAMLATGLALFAQCRKEMQS